MNKIPNTFEKWKIDVQNVQSKDSQPTKTISIINLDQGSVKQKEKEEERVRKKRSIMRMPHISVYARRST